MFFTIFNLFKGRFSKEQISKAKANDSKMSRQEALQQMFNLAKKSGK